MQFDKTRIAVRERSYLELLDLAVKVLAKHAWPLTVCLFVGATPFAIFNSWLFSDLVRDDLLGLSLPEEVTDWIGNLLGYAFFLSFFIVWQIPLATAPITLYLGRALFEDDPKPWPIVKDWLRMLPQLILCQVVLRGVLTFFLLTWFVLFGIWPYLNEVILLERNPLFKRGQHGMSTIGRAVNLHGSNIGDLFGRWIVATLLGAAWAFCLWLALWQLRAKLTDSGIDAFAYTVLLQLAIWLVIGYFAVVRFLSYLDLRIKGEGWEVELRMRAEAARLARQIAA